MLPQQQGQEGPGFFQQTRNALTVVEFVARTFAVTVEVFIHKPSTFGERYIGLQGAAAILLILLYAAFWEGHDVSGLLHFLLAYVGMCMIVRGCTLIRRWRGGSQEHSAYTGYPRVWRFFPRLSEERVKCMVEPAMVVLIGAALTEFSPPLGCYVMLSAVGLFIATNLSVGRMRQRAMDMNDASVDLRRVAEHWRHLRGDRS